MKVHAALKASLKAQPPTQPLKNLQKTCMKFVNDVEEFSLEKFAHDSPKDVKAESPQDVKAKSITWTWWWWLLTSAGWGRPTCRRRSRSGA